MPNSKKSLSTSKTKKIKPGGQKKLESGDDLALQALSQPQKSAKPDKSDSELAESDQFAETLTSLQNIIERNAHQLEKVQQELKEKREMVKNVFGNDTELVAAQEQVQSYSSQLKERKAKLQADPQTTALNIQIGELNENKKEIEESLSNHLVNYYQMTNSKSFDTSDGDQWDFVIKAKVRPRKKIKD